MSSFEEIASGDLEPLPNAAALQDEIVKLAVWINDAGAPNAMDAFSDLLLRPDARHHEHYVEALLQLRDNEAKKALDAIQMVRTLPHRRPLPQLIWLKWLDDTPESHPLRRNALYLLIKLASRSNEFPPSLFVTGVDIGENRDPVANGGFADIFRGNLKGLAVAVKRVGRFSQHDRSEIHAVGICLFEVSSLKAS